MHLSTEFSSVLFFPIKNIIQFLHFFSISNARITELEIELQHLQLENTELRKKILLDTSDLKTPNYKLLKAHIIGRDPSNINGYLYVDKEQAHRLYVNQPVVSLNGLVGKIKYIGTNYCIVETIENQGFAVSALDVNTGIHGIVRKKGELIFDYIKIDDEIHLGDSIHTSGMSEIFPEGILIGRVKKIEKGTNLFFKPVYITPSVHINRLTYVYIVSGIKVTISEKSKEPFSRTNARLESIIP